MQIKKEGNIYLLQKAFTYNEKYCITVCVKKIGGIYGTKRD